jgi:hypothetical protein
MKNSLLLLGLLLVLCISLPFIFNVKYNENFATYPSATDISFSDASFSEGMTNPATAPTVAVNSKVASVDPTALSVTQPAVEVTQPTPIYSNSLDDNVYSSYDKQIDKNLRNKGNSLSDYMRKNPPDTKDEFKNEVESNTSILDFLIGLYRNNKEAFTSTRTLKDVSNDTTYDILPNQELYNIDGELKLGTHDSTDYGALLENVKKDFNELKNKHDTNNYVTKTDVASGLDDLTQKVTDIINGLGGGKPGSMPPGMPGSTSPGMPAATPPGSVAPVPDSMSGSTTSSTDNTTSGSTTSSTSGSTPSSTSGTTGTVSDQTSTMIAPTMPGSTMSGSNMPGSTMPGSTSTMNSGSAGTPPAPAGAAETATNNKGASKCIANFGTEIDEPLCCGQQGVLKSTKYTCPENYPTCTGYKCGSNFGTCS